MKCPKPNNCYFLYNGECYAKHWYECAEGFLHNRKREMMKGNKRNRYCKEGGEKNECI